MTRMTFRNLGAIAMSAAVLVMASAPAEARRGGSFGSRGSRTYVAPPPTRTATAPAPVQRSMADKPAPAAATPGGMQQKAAGASRGGLAKGLIGGLVAGGLIGMLLGNGFGALNAAGIMSALLQVALIGGLVWLALRLFRRRPSASPAGGPAMSPYSASPFAGGQGGSGLGNGFGQGGVSQGGFGQGGFGRGSFGGAGGAFSSARAAAPVQTRDLEITMADKQAFERLLGEVQDAFGREDYARLRACTTPEVMSYLAEELSQNATRGQRNEVSGTELLEAEVAEAWSENGTDYATIAMQYQSIDVMRDRTSGAVIEGDADRPTRATEVWTFTRDAEGAWRLSAIQEA